MGLVNSIDLILLLVFFYSAFIAISLPAISATFEDLVKRLGSFDTDLIGLEQASPSLAYIVGPILAGFIAVELTEQKVFFVLGLLLAFVSVTSFILTPRKIKMPQSELLKLT